jgi:hypothetical protein
MGAYFCQQGAIKRVTSYRVLMSFMCNKGWYCQFLEEDCRTPLGLTLTFAHPDKIVEIFESWGENKQLEYRSALEYGITQGRGSIWLRLTPEERAKLKPR